MVISGIKEKKKKKEILFYQVGKKHTHTHNNPPPTQKPLGSLLILPELQLSSEV